MGFGCIICTEDFGSSENEEKFPMCIKNCGHVFHKSCLNIWLSKSLSCPVCRTATINSTLYITKLHFQNLAMDNSNILGLLDETDKLRDELKKKDNIIKEQDKKISEMLASLKKINNLCVAFEKSTNAAIGSLLTDSNGIDSSGGASTRPQRVVRLVSSRTIQGRAPVSSSTNAVRQIASRAGTAASSSTTRQTAMRGRSVSSGTLLRHA